MGGPRGLLNRAQTVVARAREVTDHPVLTHVARVGLIAYGVMHFLIGYLAIRLAWGLRGADADQTGALQTVADGPGGAVLLWIIGLGMLALALWQAGEVLLWWRGLRDPRHRRRTALVCAKCLAKALVYAVLGITALLFAVGLEYEADERLRDVTDATLEIPGGAVLVGAVAVAVVAVGLYTLVRGVTGGFMKDIDLPAAPDRWEPLIEGIGRVRVRSGHLRRRRPQGLGRRVAVGVPGPGQRVEAERGEPHGDRGEQPGPGRDGGDRGQGAVQARRGRHVGGRRGPPQQDPDQRERGTLGHVPDPADALDERFPAVGGRRRRR